MVVSTIAVGCCQVWRMAHEPVRGVLWVGTRPMVHSGFYLNWTSKGLNRQVLSHLQVPLGSPPHLPHAAHGMLILPPALSNMQLFWSVPS